VVAEAEESTTGTPPPGTGETEQTDPVPRLAMVGGAVVLLIGGIAAATSQWRKKKNNAEEPGTGQEQEASVVPQVVQFANLKKLPMDEDGKVLAIGASLPCDEVFVDFDTGGMLEASLADAVFVDSDSMHEGSLGDSLAHV